MLDLTYDKTVHIDKWDIDVVPYLTLGVLLMTLLRAIMD